MIVHSIPGLFFHVFPISRGFLRSALLCLLRTAKALARRATKSAKDKFKQRVARLAERRRKAGKPEPIFYTTGLNSRGAKTFSGGPALHSTSVYPQRFCTALFKAWLRAREEM